MQQIEPPPANYPDPHQWMIGQYYRAMANEIAGRYNEITDATPENQRIKAVCLLLMKRDRQGGDNPDMPVMANGPTFGPNGAACIMGDLMPAWATYIHRAKEMLEVMNEIETFSR